MVHDVFISYPHQEKVVADASCVRLEAAGVRCWIAPRDINPGVEWASSIVDAIDKCRLMVLIFSSYTNVSKQVHREVQQAFESEKPVVPFRIENVSPEKALRYYIGSVHWLDAVTPPVEEHLKKLVAIVRGLVHRPILNAAVDTKRPQVSSLRPAAFRLSARLLVTAVASWASGDLLFGDLPFESY